MSTGSTYGAGLYSANNYSWLTVWFQVACAPVTYRDRPLVPVVKPDWQPITCQAVNTRRGNSSHAN